MERERAKSCKTENGLMDASEMKRDREMNLLVQFSLQG
jgi:hypothetical protein